ncbi:hypothetical protein ACFLV7_02485 [Chloroflexota bacterium]
MTKIFDLVEFHAGYGEQVRLLEYFYDEDVNRKHMKGYVPIRAHREAFTELVKAQLPDKENKDKVIMLTGSYGTGKSHLCLMLANYFSLKPTDLEMDVFFKNWSKRDPDGAAKVRNWRGDGRYLVAPAEFGESKPFEDMVILAIEQALMDEGAQDVILNTHFKAAVRQIEDWEKRKKSGEPSGIYDDFLAYLGGDNPGEELNRLKKDLEQNKSSAMDRFQDVHVKATGRKLGFQNDSLIAIMRDLLSSQEFQKRYKGLVILADEFGYALDDERVKMSVFHSFAEMSKDGIDGMQLIFIGTGHRRFEAYGSDKTSQVDYRVVQDRVTEVSLESDELEQIIAALVSPKTGEPVWNELVIGKNEWLLNRMASEAKKAKLFDYLTESEIRKQIVENIYPMHPMATHCLTKMSQELGSDARSVFSFFRKYGEFPPEGGYSWFAQNKDVAKEGLTELNIYTPDILATYFSPDIKTTNLDVRPEIRDYIRNYLSAVEEARRYAFKHSITQEIDPFTQQVLDLILVFRVSQVHVTKDTLEYGLNLHKPTEKKLLKNEIGQLLKNKIIFKSPSGEYEFRRSDMADIEALIAETRKELLQEPLNLPELMTSLVSKRFVDYTDAKGHNNKYLGDKRLKRVFALPKELSSNYKSIKTGEQISYWQFLEEQMTTQSDWKSQYDGVMVYMLCETPEDVQATQHSAKSNNTTSMIVGVPKDPILAQDAVVNLLSIQRFMESDEYGKLDFQEQSQVTDRLGKDTQKTGQIGDFMKVREKYLSAKEMIWYREDGKNLVSDPNTEHDPADALMDRNYKERNQVSHEYLSKSHPARFTGAKDSALRDAVATLVEIDKPIEIDHNAKDNRGEIRYLKFALANHSVLQQEGDYQGSTATYTLENNPGFYKSKYPSLSKLIGDLKALKPGKSINIWEKLSALTQPPYGVGPYALSLYFGCAIRHFGDELRMKIDPQGFGYSPTSDADLVIGIATGDYPATIVERRFINKATSQLINAIYNLFSESPAPAGSNQTLAEAWNALSQWWEKRTKLEKAPGIYQDDSTVQQLINFMAQNAGSNQGGSQILLEELKQIYGYSADATLDKAASDEILANLIQDKQMMERRVKAIKEVLIQELVKPFNPSGDTYIAYSQAINTWFSGLHPEQTLINANWQSEKTRALLQAIPRLQDVEKFFLDTIPASFGFGLGKVDDWSYDQSEIYISRFNDAFEKIESSLPKVPAPIWETSVKAESYTYSDDQRVNFRGTVKLSVKVPEGGMVVRISRNEDPIQTKQFNEVEGFEEMTVAQSCTYYLVTQDAQGDFSKVIKIIFTNKDEGYKVIAETAPELAAEDRQYRYRNPVDRDALVVLFRSMIAYFKLDKLLTEDDIRKAFQQILDKDISEE